MTPRPVRGPGWNYSYIGRTDQTPQRVVAAGATEAWAYGRRDVSINGSVPLLHFDGRSWREQSLPQTSQPVELDWIAASGPDNVWVFAHTKSALTKVSFPASEAVPPLPVEDLP
ncbi:hypothetical protein [Actinoallomurus sp. NPDC052274]|uniref:hypothetical protein n=1 Tax=Actinoallomurus sp. NPDC052274 TaxID=3155420 RepID=UPI00344A813D